MHGDELGAVGKGRFDLDVRNHFRHAVHDVIAREERGAELHQLGDGPETVRRRLEQAWRALRPPVLGMEAERPRIWNT